MELFSKVLKNHLKAYRNLYHQLIVHLLSVFEGDSTKIKAEDEE